MSVNLHIIVGNLGRDPEVRYTSSGGTVTTFSVATTYRSSGSEGKEYTSWHKVVAFSPIAETCAESLRKGSKVHVRGRVNTRSYEKDGSMRYVTETVAQFVEFLDGQAPKGLPSDAEVGAGAVLEGDIPF